MMGLSDGRKSFPIGLAVLIQYRPECDSQLATQPRRCSYYAQRSGVEPKNKNQSITSKCSKKAVPFFALFLLQNRFLALVLPNLN